MADAAGNSSERLVFLVQHGQAKSKSEDPDRPLTEEGVRTVEQVAQWAAERLLQVNEIRHSGKLRAEQTAALLARKLEPRDGIAAYPGLGPNDDVEPVAEALSDCPGSVMIVGHLPLLSRLASLLLVDDPKREVVRFRNGGLVGLVHENQGWKVACAIPPELAGP
jgi:phosphohistidine phosphatase